jgi:CheY-like chemotaxis protein
MTADIVIIENDLEIRDVMQELLEEHGYTVKNFAEGRPALEYLQENPGTRLVLLDLLMPVMNGWEFMAEFTKLPAPILPIPVYIFSATNEVNGATNAMGAKGFVKKPAKSEVLLQLVKEYCRPN